MGLRFVSCRSPCCHGFPRSHCFAHALWRGRVSVCVGVAAGLVVGVFACGRRGFVFAWVFAWVVCAFWCWRFGGGGGTSLSHCPQTLTALGWVGFWRSRSLVWALLACALACARGAGRQGGAGHDCPAPPLRCWVALSPPVRARGERKRVVGWGCSRGGEHTHTQREGARGRARAWSGRGRRLPVSGVSALVAGCKPAGGVKGWWG